MAETLAVLFLRFKGYRILVQRFRTPVGEVDIVAKRGASIVFVEVKKRKTAAAALESISQHNAARVRRAAQWWLQRNTMLADKCNIRFDALALSPYCRIRHIENAF